MTDAERVIELRKALRFALICACGDDIEALSILFSNGNKKELLNMAEGLSKVIEDTTVELYFKKALEL